MDALTAVIWDFDGTLVDSTAKNLAVTRALLRDLFGAEAADRPALHDLLSYRAALRRHRGWQDFYRQDLRLSDEQALFAASHWLQYQLRDDTIPVPFEGISTVVQELAHLPQAIVSLNARDNILRLIAQYGIEPHFSAVLGFEAVTPEQQKPAPEALLMCIEQVTAMRPGSVLYIGDHESDTRCVVAANRRLQGTGTSVQVFSAAALFEDPDADAAWETRADYRVTHPSQLLGIVAELAGS